MSSDLFVFDGSSSSSMNMFHSASPDEADFLFADHEFSPFSDSAIDILQALSDHQTAQTTQPPPNHPDPPNTTALAQTTSPPSHELQSLTLCHQTASDLALGDHLFRVKTEQCHSGFDQLLLQRSFSSNSFEQKPCSSSSSFSFSPRFDALIEPQPFLQSQALSSPETGFFSGQMRRVCSTGDLQNYGTVRGTQRSVSSPLEEASFKVGKYSAEERKERISKYRAKRTLRNFNKTIKYACRKTLADNRPRIRGRFARNDEPVVSGNDIIPKAPSSSSSRLDDYDDDDLWLEGLHGEEEDSTDHTVRGQFLNSYGPTQFQYYGF